MFAANMRGKHKVEELKSTIVDKIKPDLKQMCIFSLQATFQTIILEFDAFKDMFWHKN